MVMELWLFSTICGALVANCFLLGYILFKKIKSSAAFYYFLFTFSVVLHTLGDLFFQLATSIRDAIPWAHLYWAGFIFMAALFFLFATSFPRSRKIIFESEKSKSLVLLFPLFLTYLLLFSKDFVSNIGISDTTVNFVIYGNIYWLVVTYLAIFLGGGFVVLFQEYRKTVVRSEKTNIQLVFISTFIAAFFGLLGDAFLIRALGFGELKLASVIMFFCTILMGYVAVQHKIFVIKPVSEENVETKISFSAEMGKIYSFEEKSESRRRAMRIFADQVKHNRQGLLVSTFYPEQIRTIYSIPKTPIIWLSSGKQSSTEKITPKEIDTLNRSVCLFMDKASSPIILIEGIKPLVVENSAEKVVELLDSISTKAKETHATIFFSLKGQEVYFMELFNEVNSLKSDLSEANKKLYSHQLSEEAFLELAQDVEKEIIQKEAEAKLIEEEFLGKTLGMPDPERKRILLEKCVQIINYKIGKRNLDSRISLPLRDEFQKQLLTAEQQLKKKNLVEKY